VFLSFFGVAPIIGDFSSFFTKNFWTSSLTEIKPSRPRKKREPQGAAPPSIIGHYLLQLLPRLGRRGLGWISPKQHHDHQDIFWYPWNLFDLILVEGTYPACAPGPPLSLFAGLPDFVFPFSKAYQIELTEKS